MDHQIVRGLFEWTAAAAANSASMANWPGD